MTKAFTALLLCILLLSVSIHALAHGGKTDENGGHYDYSTGEYHYHHGYPAHQHPNGICPYEYDDQTDHSTKSISISNSSLYPTSAPRPSVAPRATATPRPAILTQVSSSVENANPYIGALSAVAGASAYGIICKVCKKRNDIS